MLQWESSLLILILVSDLIKNDGYFLVKRYMQFGRKRGWGKRMWCICLVLTLANLHMARVSPLVVFTIKESYKLFICLLFTATTKYVTVATRITGLTNSQRRIVSI